MPIWAVRLSSFPSNLTSYSAPSATSVSSALIHYIGLQVLPLFFIHIPHQPPGLTSCCFLFISLSLSGLPSSLSFTEFCASLPPVSYISHPLSNLSLPHPSSPSMILCQLHISLLITASDFSALLSLQHLLSSVYIFNQFTRPVSRTVCYQTQSYICTSSSRRFLTGRSTKKRHGL